MTSHDLALALLRTTLVTSAAACVAGALLAWLKVDSPRTHRVAWLLVVAQGWLLIPWTLQIETLPPPPPPAARVVEIPQAFVPLDPVDIPFVAQQLPPPEVPPAPFPIAAVGISTWLLGAAVLALIAAVRYAAIVRTLPRGEAPDDPQWQHEWRRAVRRSLASRQGGTPKVSRRAWSRTKPSTTSTTPCEDLGVPPSFPRIDFRLTTNLGPLVAFIPWRYLLLAPRPLWTALTSPERSAILRHELAHICRRDLWKSLAFRILALPQWFNPLVWLAARRFDEAAEWHCDQLAARGLARNQTTLASSLLRSAELTTLNHPPRTLGFLAAVPTARRSSALARRIQRLITPRFNEESTMKRLAIPALLAAIAAAQLIRIEHVAAEPAPTTSLPAANAIPSPSAVRKDYKETVWPRYVIEPPDILLVEGVKLVPKSPHRIETFDVLLIRVVGALQDQPIDDQYNVDADGSVNLGPTYGRIKVVNLTIKEAEEEIREQLARILTDAEVSASLLASAGAQQITGQHLVAMDGRANLGAYGSVFVAGMTIEQAKEAIEQKLAEVLDQPQVAVDVLAYNSKVYYIITKGAGLGDDVVRAPITGNETVLDAIASLGGFHSSPATKMWIARPAGNGVGVEQILHVSWNEIASGASTATNYQLMPGDRLFIDKPHYQTPPPAANHIGLPTAPATKAVAVLSLHWKDSDGSEPSLETIVELAPRETIATFLKRIELPKACRNPPDINLADAQITLGRDVKDGLGISHRAGTLILWDKSAEMPRGDDENVELQHGDVVTVDLRKPPVPPLPQPAAAPVPIAPSPVALTTVTTTRIDDLQPHDVITVLVDYGKQKDAGAAAKRLRPQSFQIACEITEILPNGNLSIEGHQAIIKDGKQQRISLTGEVRPEVVSPNRTVSSRSIAELNIDILNVAETADAPPVAPASVATPAAPVAVVPPPSAEMQAILDEAAAAREAGEHDRETAALARLPSIIEPPDILTIAYGGRGEAPARGIAPNGNSVELGGKTRFDSRPTNFLVAMDGRVNLGDYGSVFVAGMTTDQAAAAIKQSLSKSVDEPHAAVKVAIANSKVYYIITKGGGLGDDVVRAPVQDNLTVLDAIVALYNGRPSPQTKMWIARPGGNGVGVETILTIQWHEITSGKSGATNYLLRAGDRLFIEEPQDDRTRPAATEPAGEPPSTIAKQSIAPPPVAPQPADAPASITLEIHPAEGDKLRIAMPLSEGMKLSDVLVESNYYPTVDYPDALIILTRKGDPATGEIMQKAIGWDKAAGTVAADDDCELQAGDEISIRARRSAPKLLENAPSVSIILRHDTKGESVQRFPFKEGLTVADVIAATVLPHPIDFARMHLTHIRPFKGAPDPKRGKQQTIEWNAVRGAPNTNYELQPGDIIRVDAGGIPLDSSLLVEHSLADSRAIPRPAAPAPPVYAFMQFVGSDKKMRNTCIHDKPLVAGQTVAELLGTLKLPQPVDFAEVQLTLSTPDANAPSRRVRRPIEWDRAANQPTVETNFALQPGAVLFIDAMASPLKADSIISPTAGYAPQPQPQPWVPVVESPIFSPQPAPMPAPMAAAPGPPAPVAKNILYKLALLEDTSGDLAEFVDSDDLLPGAIHDTAALEPALRVLKKHGLVRAIADPKILTPAGRPAQFNANAKVPGKDRLFRTAQHVKIVGREAPQFTAAGLQKEGRPINVEIEAHADHAGERCTLDAAFQLVPGQSVIARLKAKDGSASPIYLVVTPDWVE
jgi:polysaccharide export outer membrane protein